MTGVALDKNKITKKWGRMVRKPVDLCYKDIIGPAASETLEMD